LMHADHDGLYALRCVLYGSALWLHGIRESYAARCMVFVACRFYAARKGRAVRAAKIRMVERHLVPAAGCALPVRVVVACCVVYTAP
jgi:hypothetical protein